MEGLAYDKQGWTAVVSTALFVMLIIAISLIRCLSCAGRRAGDRSAGQQW